MSSMYKHSELKYFITTDVDKFDMNQVHSWLSVDAYWSRSIPFDTVEKAFRNSVAFGLFQESGEQIGIARIVTDRATFGYLADVFIAPSARGSGLAKWMMTVIMAHPELQGLRRTMLATRDMHKLYEKFGFNRVAGDDLLMEIANKNFYEGGS